MEVKGTGSITQLDKKKTPYRCREWMLQVSTAQGRKSKRFTGSMSEARIELNRFMDKIDSNCYLKIKKFTDYSNYWLSYRASCGRYSSNTIETNKKFVNKLNIIFKGRNLAEITPQLVRDTFVSVKQTKNPNCELSGTYKSHMFFRLNAILNMAVDDELISNNPCSKVKSPKKDTEEKVALDFNGLVHLLDCLDNEPMNGRVMAIYLMALLGLRRQEAIALTWDDINWNEKFISINKAFKYSDRTIGETKSKSGNRILPIPQRLENALIKWKRLCDDNLMDSNFICCNSKGTMLTCTAHYKWWDNFLRNNHIRKITYHELRHTNLTIMAQKMNPFDLKNYAGWSDLKLTKIYIHRNNESIKKVVNSFKF